MNGKQIDTTALATPTVHTLKKVRDQVVSLGNRKNRENFAKKHTLTYFRRQLKAARKLHHLTQAEMAEKLGMSCDRYQGIESGRDGNILLDTAVRLANVFHFAVEVSMVGFLPLIEHIEFPALVPNSYQVDSSKSELDLHFIRMDLEMRKKKDEKGEVSDPEEKARLHREKYPVGERVNYTAEQLKQLEEMAAEEPLGPKGQN
jgi:transcriptional regulator with XRE-family HTH domain